jgi:CO/xanthine dehydrogenase Mo-binding subunit
MRGRGVAYVHYKHNETYVAMGMEVAVERASGRINVERVACAHDCGQIINPDGVRAQVEGCILQTLSRVLMEEVQFDRFPGNERRLEQLSDHAFLRCSQARYRSRRSANRTTAGGGRGSMHTCRSGAR